MIFILGVLLVFFGLTYRRSSNDPSGVQSLGLNADAPPDDIDWNAEFEKARRLSLQEHMSFYVDEKKLRPVPSNWLARDRCPACFGQDVCEAIEQDKLRVDVELDETTEAGAKGIYRGWY